MDEGRLASLDNVDVQEVDQDFSKKIARGLLKYLHHQDNKLKIDD